MALDNQTILDSLVLWINNVTQSFIHKKYVYAGDDIGSNRGEPSKSYMQGQFYYNPLAETIYISLILDPNITWGYKYNETDVYTRIIDYISNIKNRTTLNGVKIEFLFSPDSMIDSHELETKCRTGELSNYIYGNTMYLWKDLHDKYKFITDNSLYIHDKNNIYYKTGKRDFSDYQEEIRQLNIRYNDIKTDNTRLPIAFEEYKLLYKQYFGRDLYEINSNSVVRFYLLNFTDYSIKEKKD